MSLARRCSVRIVDGLVGVGAMSRHPAPGLGMVVHHQVGLRETGRKRWMSTSATSKLNSLRQASISSRSHPEVSDGHAEHAANDRRLGARQQVAQREAAKRERGPIGSSAGG